MRINQDVSVFFNRFCWNKTPVSYLVYHTVVLFLIVKFSRRKSHLETLCTKIGKTTSTDEN